MPPRACRGCLSTGPKLYDMYTNNLHEIFGEVLGNPVFELDELPQHICGMCYVQLMKCELFRNRCRRVQDILEGALLKGMKLTTSFIKRIDRSHHKLLINLQKVNAHVDLIIQEEFKADPTDGTDQECDNQLTDADLPTEGGSPNPFKLVPISPSKPLPQPILSQSIQPFAQNLSAPIKTELTQSTMHIDDFLKTLIPYMRTKNEKVEFTNIDTVKQLKVTHSSKPSRTLKCVSKVENRQPRMKIKKQQPQYVSKFDNAEHLEQISQKYNLNIVFLSKEQQIEELQEKLLSCASKSVPFCSDCGKTFMKYKDLETHVKKFHDESAGSALCDICKYRCPEYKIKQHLRTHSLRVACKQCDFVTTRFQNSFQDVIRHANSHRSENYSCKHCELVFDDKESLNSHIINNHPNELYWCKCCGESFVSNTSVSVHLRRAHADILRSEHECQRCSLKFATSEALNKHSSLTCEPFNCLMCGIHVQSNLLLKHHVGQQHSRYKYIKLAQCMECGVKFYGTNPLAKHLEGHFCGSGLPCQECGVSCPTAESMEDHKALMHSRQEYRICDRCDKVFDEHNYRRHFERVHNTKPPQAIRRRRNPTRVWSVQGSIISALGPASDTTEGAAPRYVCGACGKGCRTLSMLNEHQKSHTTVKPFTCDVCLKGYSRKCQLVEHMYLHTGEKPNKCPHCPKAFRRANALHRHLVHHTGARPHICNLCGKAFAVAFGVKEHIRTVHLNQPSKWKRRRKALATRKPDTYDYIDTERNTRVKIVNIRRQLKKKPRNESTYNDIQTRDVMEVTQGNPTRVWSVQGSIISALGPASDTTEGAAPRYVCGACGKGCRTLSMLNEHQKSHTTVKPFTCDVCLKGYSRKCQLVEHMYLHTGEKPNKCPHCPKAFRRANALHRHLVHHTGARPHICNLCGKAFAVAFGVKEHIRTVHLNQPSKWKRRRKALATRKPDTYDYIDTERNTRVKIVNIRRQLKKKPRNESTYNDIQTRDVMEVTQGHNVNETDGFAYGTHSQSIIVKSNSTTTSATNRSVIVQQLTLDAIRSNISKQDGGDTQRQHMETRIIGWK